MHFAPLPYASRDVYNCPVIETCGEWRSLAARYVRDVEAPGSNPGSPTLLTNRHQPLLMQNAQANDNSISEIDSLHRSVSELTAIIEDNPSDSEVYYQRGVVYGQLVEPVAAIRDFDQVVRLDPINAEAYYNRGLAYVHLKEQMPAVEDFTQAIRLNPNHSDAYNNRAAAFWELGQPKRALEDVAKTLELNDQSPSAHAIGALANAYLGDEEAAEESAKKAAALGFDGSLLRHFMRQARRQRRSFGG